MNIQAQMCGIILLVTMFLFYKRYQSLRLGTQIMFQVLLFGMLFCVLCDMCSIWAIVRLLADHRGLVLAICKLYLVSLVLVGLLGFLYECSDVYEGQKKFFRVVAIGSGIWLVESIVIACLPIRIYKMGRVVYTAGPAVLSTYAFAGSFVVFNIILRLCTAGRPMPEEVR